MAVPQESFIQQPSFRAFQKLIKEGNVPDAYEMLHQFSTRQELDLIRLGAEVKDKTGTILDDVSITRLIFDKSRFNPEAMLMGLMLTDIDPNLDDDQQVEILYPSKSHDGEMRKLVMKKSTALALVDKAFSRFPGARAMLEKCMRAYETYRDITAIANTGNLANTRHLLLEELKDRVTITPYKRILESVSSAAMMQPDVLKPLFASEAPQRDIGKVIGHSRRPQRIEIKGLDLTYLPLRSELLELGIEIYTEVEGSPDLQRKQILRVLPLFAGILTAQMDKENNTVTLLYPHADGHFTRMMLDQEMYRKLANQCQFFLDAQFDDGPYRNGLNAYIVSLINSIKPDIDQPDVPNNQMVSQMEIHEFRADIREQKAREQLNDAVFLL